MKRFTLITFMLLLTACQQATATPQPDPTHIPPIGKPIARLIVVRADVEFFPVPIGRQFAYALGNADIYVDEENTVIYKVTHVSLETEVRYFPAVRKNEHGVWRISDGVNAVADYDPNDPSQAVHLGLYETRGTLQQPKGYGVYVIMRDGVWHMSVAPPID